MVSKKFLNGVVWQYFLLLEDGMSIHDLSHAAGIAYTSFHRRFIPLLLADGLITAKKDGRKIRYYRTFRGLAVRELVLALLGV